MSTTTLEEPPAGASRGRSVHPAVAALAGDVDGVVAALGQMDGWLAVDSLLAVQGLLSRLTGVSAQLTSRVEADGLWALSGGRSLADWLAAGAGLPHHRAKEHVALGRALRDHLPAAAEAVLAGQVPVAQALTLARYVVNTVARQQALAAPAADCGEEFLLAHAKEQSADGFRTLVRRWASAADPAADERGYQEAADREFVALSPTLGGTHLAGFLTVEHGALLGTALDAVMTPPAGDDARTTQQRRAGALVDVAKLALDHGLVGTGAAVRPHLSVVVDYDTLTRTLTGERPGACVECTGGTVAGPGSALFRLEPVADVERFAVAEIVGIGPVPPSVLARLACDSEISRIVFGPDSQVIDAGRAERTFSGPRRRSIIARDQTCRYPGCTAPPALGEIHHIDWWARDRGDTDTNTGVLLCWHHHDLVHRLHVTISRSPTGGFTFTTRHGRHITARC